MRGNRACRTSVRLITTSDPIGPHRAKMGPHRPTSDRIGPHWSKTAPHRTYRPKCSQTAGKQLNHRKRPRAESASTMEWLISLSFLFFRLISTSLCLGQTTCTTPGISVVHATAPMVSGVTPESHKSRHNTSRYGPSFLIDGGPFISFISAAFC